MKTAIKKVTVRSLKPNPHRMMATYPISQKKVDALKRSIEEVGLWEGIIAREKGAGYQIAFGHHRVEALKQIKMKEVNVIVRDLNDEEMLKFMGRENLEDYNTEFLVMPNTWDAGVKFSQRVGINPQPIDTARILGWTRMHAVSDLLS